MTFVSGSGSGNPVFDYSSRDYASVYADLLARIPVYLPEWTSTSSSDFGQVLLQMYAYTADLLGYYEDRIAGEAFIQTATQAVSVLNLAAMLDYQPTLSTGAVATLAITISSSVIGPVIIPAGTQFSTQSSPTSPGIVFTTNTTLTIAGANNATPSTTGFVVATQGIQVTGEPVATSNGSINQTYSLNYHPVSALSYHVFVDLGLGPHEWVYKQTLINSGPYDQVYTTFVDANGVFYVIFGDGVNGYVPTLGSPVTSNYQVSVGASGNVGASTIVVSVTAIIGLSSVVNPLSATGGADAESIRSIQVNAPASLKTLNRAVAVGDMQTLAIQVPGVQWASVEQLTYQLVNLYIAPFGGGSPSSVLQTAVLNYIYPLSMVNTTISIYPPTYVPINVTVRAVVYNNYSNSATKVEILKSFADLLAQSATGFGFRVSLGLVYQSVLAQTGVNYAIVGNLSRQMLAQLTSPLINGGVYGNLLVSQLPQDVLVGDSILINPTLNPSQIVTAVAPAAAGSTQIAVQSFISAGTYVVGTSIQDTTGVNDAILLPNEIPIAGTFTVTVSGGLA